MHTNYKGSKSQVSYQETVRDTKCTFTIKSLKRDEERTEKS